MARIGLGLHYIEAVREETENFVSVTENDLKHFAYRMLDAFELQEHR